MSETIAEICSDVTDDLIQGYYPDQMGVLELADTDEARRAEEYIGRFIKDREMPYAVHREGVEVYVTSEEMEGLDSEDIAEIKMNGEPYPGV